MDSLLLIIVCAYLIGSIPFGLILAKAAGLGDIRQIGSGNIGATNVLRTGNKKIALATLVLDFCKGFMTLTFLIANGYGDALIYAAPAIALGHMFPPWLRFRGGKAVASLFGMGFALSWTVGVWMAVCWLTVFAVYRYSSLGALLGIPAGLAIASQNVAVGGEVVPLIVPAALMIAKHHPNIRRLLKGEEHKFSFTKKDDTA